MKYCTDLPILLTFITLTVMKTGQNESLKLSNSEISLSEWIVYLSSAILYIRLYQVLSLVHNAYACFILN